MLRWVLVDIAILLATFGVCRWRMEYPWQLALFSGLAVGALSYASRRTVQNLRQVYRREPPFEAVSDAEDDGDA